MICGYISSMDVGFPAKPDIKRRVQMIYNELKCGLHANTQKYHATCPPKKAALSGNATFNL
jgi:hypothetical protein